MHLTTVDEDTHMTCEVIGVAGNARTQSLRGDVEPRYFLSAAQPPAAADSPTFLLRPSTDPAGVMSAVRDTIHRFAGSLPIMSASSLEEEMRPLIAQDRTTAQLALVFAFVALSLGAIGLYGVLSYGVARRTGEIAIRIALGATPRRVVAVILRETVTVVMLGLALGAALSYLASRLTESRLYGVAPHDPATIAFAAGLLLGVALTAAYIPARRASRLDPIAALRQT
jgi:ABC-type antimicrobial peptide transport system permease subunit